MLNFPTEKALVAEPFSVIQPLVISRQKNFSRHFSGQIGSIHTGLKFVSCLGAEKMGGHTHTHTHTHTDGIRIIYFTF